MPRDGLTDERYRELFAEQKELGLSYDELAHRAGVKASTLRWKKSELKRSARQREAGMAPVSPTFLPVRVRPSSVANAVVLGEVAPSPYEVRLNSGRMLRVPRDFRANEVQALVCVLETVPC